MKKKLKNSVEEKSMDGCGGWSTDVIEREMNVDKVMGSFVESKRRSYEMLEAWLLEEDCSAAWDPCLF